MQTKRKVYTASCGVSNISINCIFNSTKYLFFVHVRLCLTENKQKIVNLMRKRKYFTRWQFCIRTMQFGNGQFLGKKKCKHEGPLLNLTISGA